VTKELEKKNSKISFLDLLFALQQQQKDFLAT
jgi:hypothetical protein